MDSLGCELDRDRCGPSVVTMFVDGAMTFGSLWPGWIGALRARVSGPSLGLVETPSDQALGAYTQYKLRLYRSYTST